MPIYSHSRLECYETCPLKYRLSYIDNIKREQEGVEAFVGSRFHETMEMLYKDLKCKTYSLDELLDLYEAAWDKEWNDDIVVTRKDRTAKDYRTIGRKCVEAYYKRYSPFDQGRILGLEREVQIDLKGDGKYKMRGYIDRIVQADDGTYEIHDYKTSGYLPAQKDLDENRQLALYQLGIEGMWNDVKKTRLVWHYVVFDKEMVSTRSREQLEHLKKDTIAVIDRLEAETEFAPKESKLCDWCSYPDLCPKRKHLYKVEALPVNRYLKDSGVKLANTYAKLAAKKRECNEEIDKIDEEMDKLKEAVIKYAKKEGVDVIKGSNNKLKISEKQKVSAPSKGSPEREKLEKMLHDVNKWDDVCGLDTHALEKAITEAAWDKKIIDKVKKFITIEVRTSVSMSKLGEKEK